MNNIRPKNPLLWIKYRILEWQWDRVLKNSGYSHWESYLRYNDPDFHIRGRTVRDQLHGYPYIVIVDHKHLETTFNSIWGPLENADHIRVWCDRNCHNKYRWHWERVVQDHNGQYLPNGIGGTDELFFGFKDERDYTMFVLRWG